VYAWEGALHVVIYGERLNLRNFWSGSWLSVWEIKDKQLSGTIKVRAPSFAACFSAPLSLTFSHDQLRAHYFEKGNVQMQTTKTLPPTSLPPTDDETTAAVAVVDAIQQAEATVQVSGL
jgi:capping protein (actin filament) muscle Z-line, alpha